MEIEMNNMNSNANNAYDNAFSSVTPEELENWDKDSYRIIDVREDADYEKDSIPGSIHLPLDGILNGSAKLPAEIEAGRAATALIISRAATAAMSMRMPAGRQRMKSGARTSKSPSGDASRRTSMDGSVMRSANTISYSPGIKSQSASPAAKIRCAWQNCFRK